MAILLVSLSCAPYTASEDIPVVAYILNAQPEVLELYIGEGIGAPNAVDPGSKFTIKVKVRDNNTIADVTRLRVVLYSPSSTEGSQDSEVHHYTFGWTSSAGFANQGGVGDLFTGECAAPSDPASATGTWVFVARLDRSASYSSRWTLVATAQDESENGRAAGTFAVNAYTSMFLQATKVTFSGSPGSLVRADQNPIVLRYASNGNCDLGCWATTFSGTRRPEIVLKPSSFTIDDDPDPTAPADPGARSLTLSEARQSFVALLPAKDGQLQVYLFIRIPDPFLDQDYAGQVFLDMAS